MIFGQGYSRRFAWRGRHFYMAVIFSHLDFAEIRHTDPSDRIGCHNNSRYAQPNLMGWRALSALTLGAI